MPIWCVMPDVDGVRGLSGLHDYDGNDLQETVVGLRPSLSSFAEVAIRA